MKDKYDVIIIGAGIGGLVCGCYLAKAGIRVLIIEKNDKCGGSVTTLDKDGFKIDMGAHLVGGFRKNGLLNRYLKELDISLESIDLNPMDRFYFGTDIFDIPNDIDLYIEKLQNMFPFESDNISKFFKEMSRICRKLLSNDPSLSKYQNYTFQDCLDEYFKNQRLNSILAAHSNIVGLPSERSSFIFMSLLMITYIRDGMSYVKGGMQKLPDSICKKIKEYSGDILLSAEVLKIVVEKNRIRTVITTKGDFCAEKLVISNIDASKTLLSMIGEEFLPIDYVAKINRLKKGPSIYFLHMITTLGSEDLRLLSGWHFKSYETSTNIDETIYYFVPSLFDRSVMCEKEGNIIQSFMFVPNSIAHLHCCKKPDAIFEEKILTRLERILARKMAGKISIKIASDPCDIESFTGNSDGSISGWEMSPQATLYNRLGWQTPINNLYLTGHWTNPGCGVLGASTSGRIAAKRALEYIGDKKI